MILGYDFLCKHGISITSAFNSILIKEIHVPFVNSHQLPNDSDLDQAEVFLYQQNNNHNVSSCDDNTVQNLNATLQ